MPGRLSPSLACNCPPCPPPSLCNCIFCPECDSEPNGSHPLKVVIRVTGVSNGDCEDCEQLDGVPLTRCTDGTSACEYEAAVDNPTTPGCDFYVRATILGDRWRVQFWDGQPWPSGTLEAEYQSPTISGQCMSEQRCTNTGNGVEVQCGWPGSLFLTPQERCENSDCRFCVDSLEPRRWQITITGITDATCTTGFCGNLNGTYIIETSGCGGVLSNPCPEDPLGWYETCEPDFFGGIPSYCSFFHVPDAFIRLEIFSGNVIRVTIQDPAASPSWIFTWEQTYPLGDGTIDCLNLANESLPPSPATGFCSNVGSSCLLTALAS